MTVLLQAVENYGRRIWGRKGRLFLAVISSAILLAGSFRYLYNGVNKLFWVFILFSLLAGALLVCPKPEKWYLTLPLAALYVILVPQKIFQRMELPLHEMNYLREGAEFVNILIILLVYAILLLLFQRIHLALGGGTAILFALFLINYYFTRSQGGQFKFHNLAEPQTLFFILGNGRVGMDGDLWYSILYFCLLTVLGFWCGAGGKGKKYHLAVSALSISYCLFFLGFWNASGYLEKHGLGGDYGNTWEGEYRDGFLLSFSVSMGRSSADIMNGWYDNFPTICHALGMTEEGDTLTNSREALEYNYALGQRVFEADISVTSDNVAVLRHDWSSDLGQAQEFGWTKEEKPVPTAEEFLRTPIYGKYTPMTLLDLYGVMAEVNDMYVVIDPKYSPDVNAQFTLLVNTALDNGYEEVLDRIVVQIYYEQMYDEVEAVYHFKNYLYTLYYIGFPGGAEAGTFCEEHGIPVLVMPYTWIGNSILQDLEGYPLRLYVHTVNEQEDALRMTSMGVEGIYTDCITPEEVKRFLLER